MIAAPGAPYAVDFFKDARFRASRGYREDKGHGSLAQGSLRRLNGPFGWSAKQSRTEIPLGMARHSREIVAVCR